MINITRTELLLLALSACLLLGFNQGVFAQHPLSDCLNHCIFSVSCCSRLAISDCQALSEEKRAGQCFSACARRHLPERWSGMGESHRRWPRQRPARQSTETSQLELGAAVWCIAADADRSGCVAGDG